MTDEAYLQLREVAKRIVRINCDPGWLPEEEKTEEYRADNQYMKDEGERRVLEMVEDPDFVITNRGDVDKMSKRLTFDIAVDWTLERIQEALQ